MERGRVRQNRWRLLTLNHYSNDSLTTSVDRARPGLTHQDVLKSLKGNETTLFRALLIVILELIFPPSVDSLGGSHKLLLQVVTHICELLLGLFRSINERLRLLPRVGPQRI